MSELLDREGILELLRQLGARLDARGLHADVYAVGGTAMVLAYDRLRLTRDVDGITESQDTVETEARAMARERRGLDPNWFNGRVRALLPQVVDEDALEVFAAPGISVSVASARHMIAMKVRAARGDRDLEDISLLSEQLGIRSISAVLALADDVWGPGMVRAECAFLVTEGLRDRGFAD